MWKQAIIENKTAFVEFWIKFCQFCLKIKGGLKLLVVTVKHAQHLQLNMHHNKEVMWVILHNYSQELHRNILTFLFLWVYQSAEVLTFTTS